MLHVWGAYGKKHRLPAAAHVRTRTSACGNAVAVAVGRAVTYRSRFHASPRRRSRKSANKWQARPRTVLLSEGGPFTNIITRGRVGFGLIIVDDRVVDKLSNRRRGPS